MGTRLELHEILKNILGSNNVYFQPPSNINIKYPCIIYKRSTGDSRFADNRSYSFMKRYQIIYIDTNPDSDIPEKIAELPMCIYDRFYTADNLNHDSFNIYF